MLKENVLFNRQRLAHGQATSNLFLNKFKLVSPTQSSWNICTRSARYLYYTAWKNTNKPKYSYP